MRSSPARLLACLAAVVGGALTVVVLYLVAVVDRQGRTVDDALMERVGDLGSAVRGDALALLGLVSSTTVGLAVVALVTVAVLRSRPARAGVVVAVVLGAQLTTQVLKNLLPGGGTDTNSLPSGHVTAVAALGVGLVLVLPGLLRPLAALLGLGAVGVFGTATMVAQWHRPADVLAALGVVVAVAGAALAAEALLAPRTEPARPARVLREEGPRTRPLPHPRPGQVPGRRHGHPHGPTHGHDRTTVRLPVGAGR